MPRIPDELLNCAVYLYRTADDAKKGVSFGGSGFLLGVRASLPEPLDPPPPFPGPEIKKEEVTPHSSRWFCYAVSNRHVAEVAPIVRVNTHDGKTDILPLKTEDWEPHPTSDLAVAMFDLKVDVHAHC